MPFISNSSTSLTKADFWYVASVVTGRVTLQMAAVSTYETPVNLHQTARYNNAEDGDPHSRLSGT
jgi:hypothetical protein